MAAPRDPEPPYPVGEAPPVRQPPTPNGVSVPFRVRLRLMGGVFRVVQMDRGVDMEVEDWDNVQADDERAPHVWQFPAGWSVVDETIYDPQGNAQREDA